MASTTEPTKITIETKHEHTFQIWTDDEARLHIKVLYANEEGIGELELEEGAYGLYATINGREQPDFLIDFFPATQDPPGDPQLVVHGQNNYDDAAVWVRLGNEHAQVTLGPNLTGPIKPFGESQEYHFIEE